jgi:hypothetical protein
MSNATIDNHLITQFSDMLHVKSQQIKSRLRPFVKIKNLTGEVFAYDGLGDVEMTEIVSRQKPVVFDSIDHLRRKIKKRRFAVTLPIDESDARATLTNPEGDYAEACIRAAERIFDRVGIEAAFADVKTGREFGTDVTFANDGGLTIDATSGLVYEKFLEMQRKFHNNEVGTEMPENFIFLCTGDEEEDMFKETELISGDFSRRFVVDQGEISKVLKFNVLVYGASVNNPMISVTSTTRDCIAMSSRAMCYGMAVDMKLKVQDRTDLYETVQVQVIVELGAVRTEGVLMQKVQTTTK